MVEVDQKKPCEGGTGGGHGRGEEGVEEGDGSEVEREKMKREKRVSEWVR